MAVVGVCGWFVTSEIVKYRHQVQCSVCEVVFGRVRGRTRSVNACFLLERASAASRTNQPLLDYCIKYQATAIWSSAHRKIFDLMVKHLFKPHQIPQLAAIWSREDSRLGEFFNEKMQVYKHLRWLWDDPTMQASAYRSRNPDTPGTELSDPGSGTWDQTNTVLVDNSLEKADSEPYNLVQVEEFTGKAGDARDDVLSIVLA